MGTRLDGDFNVTLMLVLQVGERKLQAGPAPTFTSATWEPPGTSKGYEPGTSGSYRPETTGAYKSGTSGVNKPGTSGYYKPPVSSSSTSKRTNKPPTTTSSSEGGLLGGSSVYLTSMSNHASSVLPAGGGGISSVTSLPSSGGSLDGVTQAPSSGNDGFNIFPRGDPFAKYFRGSAHVSATTSGSGGAGGATFPASTSRLESMLERITSLGSNGGDTIIRPTPSTASVSGSSGFVSGGNHAQITMATALHSNTLSCGSYKPASATMVTRPGLSRGLDPRLVPDSMSQGMGTGSGGMIPGSTASFLPQKYLSQ